jgi:hypothetical protein
MGLVSRVSSLVTAITTEANAVRGRLTNLEQRSGRILQYVPRPFDPSGAQSATTTYADIDGSSIVFTPVSASSKIIYKYYFQQSLVAGVAIGHYRFLSDGVVQTESPRSIVDSRDIIVPFIYQLDSWGTSARTLKLQGREYTAGNEVRWHATYLMDGAISTVLVRANLEIIEYLPP